MDDDKKSVDSTPQDEESAEKGSEEESALGYILLAAIGVACLALVFEWIRTGGGFSSLEIPFLSQQQELPVAVEQSVIKEQPKLSAGSIEEPRIRSLKLIGVGLWEARLKLEYQLPADIKKGYVNAYMQDIGWHANVGLVTRPGIHGGTILLSRHPRKPQSYRSNSLHARMYDPYKNDRDYFSETYPIELTWPSLVDAGLTGKNDFKNLRHISLFRNIPQYEKFATRLAKAGLPGERMDLNLAVCPKCTPGIIFGEGVTIDALQLVFLTLKEHNYVIDRIFYSNQPRDQGRIDIGQSPPRGSKPLWKKLDVLTDPDISRDRFFAEIGFDFDTDKN